MKDTILKLHKSFHYDRWQKITIHSTTMTLKNILQCVWNYESEI